MADPNLVLDITDKNEIVMISKNRQTKLARLDPETKTIYWKDADTQASFRKSVGAFLEVQKIPVTTILMEGQKPDVVPPTAPKEPTQHFMQGDCTPAWVEWCEKWKPIQFQNEFGVYLTPLAEGEKEPANPRDRWMRADVIRTDSRPIEETHGGEYLATRFKMKNQIIARRKTHITFEKKEIFMGDKPVDQVIPYEDPYTPKKLEQMEKRGEIEVVYRRHAAASAGAQF